MRILVTDLGLSARCRALCCQTSYPNAIQNISYRPSAEIAINNYKTDQEIAFSVKDNRVGCDMQYQDRLFGIFQRLHSQDDSPGTGVGLATVRRIIHRHGRKTRIEGAINQRATFYVSLPWSVEA